MELRRTVGILTGASRGVGVYLAQHLARAGVNLALAARDEASLEGVADMVRGKGVRAITVATDVTKRSDYRDLSNGPPPSSERSTYWSTTPVSRSTASLSKPRRMTSTTSSGLTRSAPSC